jgi:hypothetical protein
MSGTSAVFGVSDVVELFGAALRQKGGLTAAQKRALTDVGQCRTAALGGHVDACDGCGTLRISYNSCRNRHCPKCQSVEREAWIISREEDLLPVTYYHVVFTIPDQINGLCLCNPRFMYDLLFGAAWQTLQTFAADRRWLGAKTGATMVLHTWGQNLSLHPHVHAIVPAGGLADDGQWQTCRATGNDHFLFPVRAMSKVFRAVFLKKCCAALEAGLLVVPDDAESFGTPSGYRQWRNGLYGKPWVVYAKRPFGGPKQVIEYLGRYTHKSAISNHRLLEVSESGVRFAYKDYREAGKKKEMTLEGEDFLRRWCLHVLPGGFRRMRHYGILSNSLKTKALEACRNSLEPHRPRAPKVKKTRQEIRELARQRLWGERDPQQCPCCQTGRLVRIGLVPPQARAPPSVMPHWVCVAE